MVFARLYYPETLIENTIRNFMEMRATENRMCVLNSKFLMNAEMPPLELCYRSTGQKSANAVRHQLGDLSRLIDAVVKPDCWCRCPACLHKSDQRTIQPKEHKLPILNQQNAVYYYNCGLCDTDYMSASWVDTFINVRRNTSNQQSAIT